MKAYLILYNQININFFDLDKSKKFLYVHHDGKINFKKQYLNLNKKSKILSFAMGYNFIQEIKKLGYSGDFLIGKSYEKSIKKYCENHKIKEIIIVKPNEDYVLQNFIKIKKDLEKTGLNINFIEDKSSFIINYKDFKQKFQKPPVMESFYRHMRKKYKVLMDGNKPVGGKWNFDSENRKFDRKHKKTYKFILKETIGLIKAKNYHKEDSEINYPTNRKQALDLLDYFLENHLDNFGKLEDAMYEDDFIVHHSNISTAMNFGLLSPIEVIKKVESTKTPINNKEGFIRQVLGWREYMNVFFNYYKEEIYKENYFNHKNKLPEFFWGKNLDKCKMNCLKTVIYNVLKNNYSHHIERLMIIGNFCLLYGVNPLEINKWFFEQYTDAFERVVTPNVLSMSQFSDGGKLATKPYVSSGNYINKMSDFCSNCSYDVKTKYESKSCPFNYLYWSFISENKETFKNKRQSFVVKNLEKIDLKKIGELKEKFMKKNVL